MRHVYDFDSSVAIFSLVLSLCRSLLSISTAAKNKIINRWRKSRGELLKKKWVNGCSLAICWWSATSLRYSLTPYSRLSRIESLSYSSQLMYLNTEYLLHVEEHRCEVTWWWWWTMWLMWFYTLANLFIVSLHKVMLLQFTCCRYLDMRIHLDSNTNRNVVIRME